MNDTRTFIERFLLAAAIEAGDRPLAHAQYCAIDRFEQALREAARWRRGEGRT